MLSLREAPGTPRADDLRVMLMMEYPRPRATLPLHGRLRAGPSQYRPPAGPASRRNAAQTARGPVQLELSRCLSQLRPDGLRPDERQRSPTEAEIETFPRPSSRGTLSRSSFSTLRGQPAVIVGAGTLRTRYGALSACQRAAKCSGHGPTALFRWIEALRGQPRARSSRTPRGPRPLRRRASARPRRYSLSAVFALRGSKSSRRERWDCSSAQD